jgi:hypothetical protein
MAKATDLKVALTAVGPVPGVALPTHSLTQAHGVPPLPNVGGGAAQKTGVVAGTGMNADRNAGFGIEAV